MLAMSVRVNPCSALWWLSSLGRPTTIWLSASESARSRCTVRVSSPLGPLTLTVWPWISAVTPPGSGTGFLPIRDMAPPPLPDHGEELAAQVGRARVPVRHQPLRRGYDGHAEAVADPRDFARLDVAPQAGARDPAQLAD